MGIEQPVVHFPNELLFVTTVSAGMRAGCACVAAHIKKTVCKVRRHIDQFMA